MRIKHLLVTVLLVALTTPFAIPSRSDAAAIDPQQAAAYVGISMTFDRYARGFDESDWAMFADAFAQDAVMDTAVGGKPGSHYANRTAIVDALRKGREEQKDVRRHFVTNLQIVSIDGRRAHVYAYHLIVVTLKSPSETRTTGVYDADLVQEADGSWRFAHLLVKLDAPY
jgi:2-polyprenyl-6-methoxyphenol hydroxylase-like FAD-dependent oxidoreductase